MFKLDVGSEVYMFSVYTDRLVQVYCFDAVCIKKEFTSSEVSNKMQKYWSTNEVLNTIERSISEA